MHFGCICIGSAYEWNLPTAKIVLAIIAVKAIIYHIQDRLVAAFSLWSVPGGIYFVYCVIE